MEDDNQLAEKRRLTSLLRAKAAKLNITVVLHAGVIDGKVVVYGEDLSQPMDSPSRVVKPE